MGKDEIHAGWQELCELFEEARANYFRALSVVNQKFISVADGSSRTNPTSFELSESEKALQLFESVKRRMDDFVKRYSKGF